MALIIAQGGIPISGTIQTTDESDVFPTHLSTLGKGGWHEVEDIDSRDAIPAERRTEGMVVSVKNSGDGTMKNYQLVGGLDNSNWEEFACTSNNGSLPTYDTMDDVNDIPKDELKEGQIIYVKDADGNGNPGTVIVVVNGDGEKELKPFPEGDGATPKVVDDMDSLNAIPEDERKEGMIVYVKDADGDGNPGNFQLVGGTSNDNWIDMSKVVGGGSFVNANPTPEKVGGVEAGTTFPDGITFEELANMLLYPYQAPAFTSLSINGAKSVYEVGESLAANSVFSFALSNAGNVKANTLKIENVTDGTVLAQDAATTSPKSTTHAAIRKTTAASHSFKVSAQNSKDQTFSKEVSVSWQWAIYSGTSTSETLDSAGVLALGNKKLGTAIAGDYSFAAGGYKYIAVPAAFAAAVKFSDKNTGFGVSMDEPVSVSVTNAQGISCEYNVYRSHFILGGTLSMKAE